ncbi:hypothetical protein GCM10020331_101300 [Ectobacillus funiculus]
MWFGGVGCAFFTLAFYYVPAFMGANYTAATIAAAGFGACLAGYVPLSALVPSLAPENKGAAMSILSLGAGLSTFVGPAIVGVFHWQLRCSRSYLDLCSSICSECILNEICHPAQKK